jgi:hypothetical protein
MKDYADILKAWAGAGVTLTIQHLGLFKEGLSLTLIALTCVYTGIKAYAELQKLKDKKKGGKE